MRQMWGTRVAVGGLLAGAAMVLSGCHGGPHLDLTVTAAADGGDVAPGDGLCEMTAGGGDCSLRAAVDEANAQPVDTFTTITLGVDVELSLAGAGEDANATGDLDVTHPLVGIVGAGHSIDAGGLDRVIDHHSGRLELTDVIIEGGQLTDGADGGGARTAGDLAVADSTFTGNVVRGDGALGGGIHGELGSSVSLARSVVTANEARAGLGSASGGGVSSQAALSVFDTEVSGNLAFGRQPRGGGVLVSGGSATIAGSTISANLVSPNNQVTPTVTGGGIALVATNATISWSVIEDHDLSAATGSGGGLYVQGGSLAADHIRVSGNRATDGAGMLLGGVSTATIDAATVIDNVAGSSGGGIGLSSSPAVVTRSTFSGNSAFTGPAVTTLNTSATLRAVTVADNHGTNALSGQMTIEGSVLVHREGRVCTNATTSQGFNVVSDLTCGTSTGDLAPANPQLGDLVTTGGPLAAHLPRPDGAGVGLVPAGTPGLCDGTTSDQWDQVRGGAPCDAGAVDGVDGSTLVPLALVVDSAADAGDAVPGDGVCDSGAGACTLRAAVDEANAIPTTDTITIAPGVDPVLSLAGVDEDGNATGDLDVADFVTIDGAGATVDAAGLDRAFHIRSTSVTLRDLVVTGGSADNGAGLRIESSAETDGVDVVDNDSVYAGAVELRPTATLAITGGTIGQNSSTGIGGGVTVHTGAHLDLVDAVVADNSAVDGAGVYVVIGGSASIAGSTFSGNVASGDGGVLWTDGNNTALAPTLYVDITNSTFSGNAAGGRGGAVFAQSGAGLSLRLVTVADSTGPEQLYTGPAGPCIPFGMGCLVTDLAHLELRGAIVVGTAPSCNQLATVESLVSSDATCGAPTLVDAATALDALADDGGPTPTRLPTAGSPAIDAISVGTAGLCDGSVVVDQRGIARPTGAACDAGATEQ